MILVHVYSILSPSGINCFPKRQLIFGKNRTQYTYYVYVGIYYACEHSRENSGTFQQNSVLSHP